MAYEEITELLGGWPGFRLVGVVREPGTAARTSPRIVLSLEAEPRRARRCSRGGDVVADVHEVTPRRARDLPILEADTWLIVPRARLKCPRCGAAVEAVPWLDRYARMTKRFTESVVRLAQVLPVKQVASHFRLSWDTVKAIDRAALLARLGPVDLSEVRQIGIEELAIQKGLRYATTIVDPVTTRGPWVGRGRGREDIRPFFELLGRTGCARLEAAGMDMSEAYKQETRAHSPQARIVYDLFHVVAKYGREVTDRVRMDETNRLARTGRRNRAVRRVIKGTRWLLLRNRQHITARQDRVRLREVLAAKHPLYVVYVLKDALKQLWRYRYAGAAQRAWRQWYGWAVRSRIAPLPTFARRFKDRLAGIRCTPASSRACTTGSR